MLINIYVYMQVSLTNRVMTEFEQGLIFKTSWFVFQLVTES